MTKLNPLCPTPETIWLFEQNKPSLVAKDLEVHGVPRHITYAILMARGVFKWLSVRRDLIKLKNHWRDEVTRTISDIRRAKTDGRGYDAAEHRGRLKALQECRAQVRELCHSERWRAPDCDGDAWRWMRSTGHAGRDLSVALRRQLRHISKWSTQAKHEDV